MFDLKMSQKLFSSKTPTSEVTKKTENPSFQYPDTSSTDKPTKNIKQWRTFAETMAEHFLNLPIDLAKHRGKKSSPI